MEDTAAAPARGAGAELRRELGFRDLVLFSLAGIIGIRWIAAAARSGPSAVTIWILGTVFFFIPSAFAIARLSARYPQTGGMYVWTRESFGDWHGCLCFLSYWLGLIFWFPSALMAYSSMTAYPLGPRFVHLADSRIYVLSASLIALMLVTIANVAGLRFGKWIDNLGGASAYLIGAVVTVLAIIVISKRGFASPFEWVSAPTWERINFWSQMAFALSGLELAPILAGEIRRPERTLPRSSLLVAPLAGLFYAACTAGVLAILPYNSVNAMHGLAQTVQAGAGEAGYLWLPPLVAVLVALSALGQFSVLGAAAARLPYAVGADRFLPQAFARVHPRWHTPYVSILVVGGIAALFLLAVQVGDTMRSAYQTVTDMMIVAGLAPFLYIFGAAWKNGARWSALFGGAATMLTLVCATVPTADVGSVWVFEAKLWGGAALIVLLARILYVRGRC